MTDSNYKILVIGPSWVGDMVMAQSLFRLLKKIHKDCLIDVIAPGWSKPLLARMPEINKAIVMPFGHGVFAAGARLKLGQSLLPEGYDQAIVLPYTWKSALVPFGAKIPKRTGFVGEMRYGLLNDIRKLDKKRLPLMVQRYVALGLDKSAEVGEYPKPLLFTEEKLQSAALRKFDIKITRKKIIAFCPGAEYGPAKRWPAENFAKLAQYLVSQGLQVWLLGSEKDKTIADEIDTLAGNNCVNLCGKTSLEDVIDLLAVADAAVCNDSGLMHITAAVDTPLVAIYGSSDPSFTPPLSDKVQIARTHIECSPCFKRECPYGHYKCLKDITSTMVASELQKALAVQFN